MYIQNDFLIMTGITVPNISREINYDGIYNGDNKLFS